MKINGEEVVPVASFDELRPGRIVYVKPCDICGETHRFLVGNPSPLRRGIVQVIPIARCCAPGGISGLCPPSGGGRLDILFLVVDGLPDQERDERDRLNLERSSSDFARVARRGDKVMTEMYRLGRLVGEYHRDLAREYGIEEP